jgi:aminotransferase in exopolysaccharide biosynthesis
MYQEIVTFIRDYYQSSDFIPLHAPVFNGQERNYVLETIDSTFVSSVGAFVDRFEQEIAAYTNSPKAVATVNGTAALHIALKLSDVKQGDLVITQPLTFVATCNAIAYCGAEPVFIDVDRKTLSLSPQAMQDWLEEQAFIDDRQQCRHRDSGRIIRSCLPMHTFGHPADLDGLIQVCSAWHINLVEDAAESLGSFYKGKHTGTLGLIGTLSFNGNKIITTGGGGMILTNEALGKRAKHITTTAKQPHPYEFVHDEVGYNYRLPNLNAALGCAQLERLEAFIAEKRALAGAYANLFNDSSLQFVVEPEHCRSNYWLNAVICESQQQRDELLTVTNEAGVMTRPVWQLMNHLSMYQHAIKGNLPNAEWLAQRLVNLPSSVKS